MTLLAPASSVAADDLTAAAFALSAAAADAEALAVTLQRFVGALDGDTAHPEELRYIEAEIGHVVAMLREAQGRLLFG